MDLLGLVLVLAVAFVVALLVIRATRGGPREEEGAAGPVRPDHRIAALCARLTGDQARDRPVLNRILSLGASVVPLLVDELAEALRQPDGPDADKLARLEELIADFGLAAIGPVAARAARIQPTTPLGPSLMRIVRRLGAPGAVAFLRAGLDQPALAPFLPRFRQTDEGYEPATVLLAALRDRPGERRRRDLEAFAGLVADHPRVIDTLWSKWDEPGRVALLEFLADWRPLADVRHARLGLADPAPSVRVAAAALASLLADAALLAPLGSLALDGDRRCRAAAAEALAAVPGAGSALEAAVADADVDVALTALLGLARRDREAAVRALDRAAALTEDPRGRLLRPALAGAGTDPAPLLDALESDDPKVREVAIAGLAALVEDPRARERLILAADALDAGDRARAVEALAQAGDSTAADLLARAVREAPARDDLRRLQHAARRLGPGALVPLARRLRSEAADRLDAQLAILRAQPYAAAVAPMLRALESVRLGEVEGALTATLHAGGPDVRAALRDGLLQPGRGLLAPALRYLAGYGTPEDLPMLVDLFDRHPPLRNVLLNLIEAQGPAAIEVLAERVRRGGEDAVLLALEQRMEVVQACAAPTP